MDKNYVSCYTFFDKKGRRLSAFCRFSSETEAEIYIITCSKADKFNKKFARKIYEDYLNGISTEKHTPIILKIAVLPEEGTLKTLLRYLSHNYYIQYYEYVPKPIYIKVEDLLF